MQPKRSATDAETDLDVRRRAWQRRAARAARREGRGRGWRRCVALPAAELAVGVAHGGPLIDVADYHQYPVGEPATRASQLSRVRTGDLADQVRRRTLVISVIAEQRGPECA